MVLVAVAVASAALSATPYVLRRTSVWMKWFVVFWLQSWRSDVVVSFEMFV